jgi:hypothetical protein
VTVALLRELNGRNNLKSKEKLASPSGHDTKGNPNWKVRIEGEVKLSA